jgi:hypothetical protein
MLASSPVRALVEPRTTSGAAVAAVAGALSFAALFFARGTTLSALVWIGSISLVLAALGGAAALLGLLPAPRLDPAGTVFLGALVSLAVWLGFTTIWSISPESSWQYTNRTLVYAAFALLGALAAAAMRRPAESIVRGAAVLAAALFGWALLSKVVPSLYSDYGRIARLRAPLEYWNELALLAGVAVPVALWLATRRYVLGTILLYGAATTLLLTYSRFGLVLACAAAVGWILLSDARVESLAASALAAVAAAAVFGIALTLHGITKDGQPHSVRAHDGWIFALAVLGGAAVAAGGAALVARRFPVAEASRRRIERWAALAGAVALLAAVVIAGVFAQRIWHSFANPLSSQITSGQSHLASFSSSNRWRWWQEAWHAFTRHPGGGTGGGTFQITDQMLRQSPLVTTEPHNVPLQFLSETGVVGFLILLAALVAGGIGVSRARARARDGAERAAVTALALGVGVFFAHLVGDTDWDYVATCGPLLFVVGALVVRDAGPAERVRRPLVAAAAVLFALAGVYSLAAPWLAQRQLANAATLAAVKRAHAYDPLSTQVLTEWAAFESPVDPLRAEQLYRDATAMEPENAYTWLALGDFYAQYKRWTEAYLAYSAAWTLDKYGPAGIPCGPLDQARHKVLKVWPPSCPAGRPASSG